MTFDLLLFYGFAAAAVVTTLLVVVQSNPVYSVLLLIGSFLALAGLYVLLEAPFLAVIQIIVYAGAIMVLFLFVVMLLNARREEAERSVMPESSGSRLLGGVLALAFALELAWALSRTQTFRGAVNNDAAVYSVPEVGVRLFREHAFAFEATSILILVALLGAVTVAGRQLAERRAAARTARADAPLTTDGRP